MPMPIDARFSRNSASPPPCGCLVCRAAIIKRQHTNIGEKSPQHSPTQSRVWRRSSHKGEMRPTTKAMKVKTSERNAIEGERCAISAAEAVEPRRCEPVLCASLWCLASSCCVAEVQCVALLSKTTVILSASATSPHTKASMRTHTQH